MKFKDKLKLLNCHELYNKLTEITTRTNLLSIVCLLSCCLYWLLHDYLISYLFIVASTIMIPIIIVMMVRIKKTEHAFIEKDKEEFARLKQKVVAIGEVIEKAIEEEGGEEEKPQGINQTYWTKTEFTGRGEKGGRV